VAGVIYPGMYTSLFDSARDNNPKRGPDTWALLVAQMYTDSLTSPHPASSLGMPGRWRDSAEWKKLKVTMPAWSPAVFSGARASANATFVSSIVGDLDGVSAERVEELKARISELGWSAFVHATPSDDPSSASRRYRFAVELGSPVTQEAFASVREAVLQLLSIALEIDKSCKDPGRLYFRPCMSEGGGGGEIWLNAGRPVDAATVERQAGIYLLSSNWPKIGERHMAQMALAGGLIRSGKTREEALEILCDVCRATGNEDRPKREVTVDTTMATFAASEPLSSWRTLETLLSSPIVNRIRSFLRASGGSVAGPGAIPVTPDVHLTIEEASKSLQRAKGVFSRELRLVRVVHDRNPSGFLVPFVMQITPPTMLEILSEHGRYTQVVMRKNEEHHQHVKPPTDVVQGVLARGQWDHVNPLVALTSAPSMRADGSILLAAGYDEATGYLYEPGADFPELPSSDADPKASLDALIAPLSDFPFFSPEGRYVVAGAILTVIARDMFTAAPAFIFEASTAGSGKSKLADFIALITTGATASRATWHGPADPETDKTLCSVALAASQTILFDNLDKPFGGAAIDKIVTTEDRIEFRLLGGNDMKKVVWRALVMATGNNVRLTGDMKSRALVVRLEPNTENPAERNDFLIPDLLSYVREHRVELVMHALIVLRAWVEAGRPRVVPSYAMNRFVSWSATIPQAIAYAGGPDISLAAASESNNSDLEDDAVRSLARSFQIAFPRGETSKEIARALWPLNGMPTKHPECAEAFESLSHAKERTLSSRHVAAVMQAIRGRVIAGKKVCQVKNKSTETIVWSVEERK